MKLGGLKLTAMTSGICLYNTTDLPPFSQNCPPQTNKQTKTTQSISFTAFTGHILLFTYKCFWWPWSYKEPWQRTRRRSRPPPSLLPTLSLSAQEPTKSYTSPQRTASCEQQKIEQGNWILKPRKKAQNQRLLHKNEFCSILPSYSSSLLLLVGYVPSYISILGSLC